MIFGHSQRVDWSDEGKPQINVYYPCKHLDDCYRIIVQQPRSELYGPLYRIVSMRGADVAFDLTLAMARVMIKTETWRMK